MTDKIVMNKNHYLYIVNLLFSRFFSSKRLQGQI